MQDNQIGKELFKRYGSKLPNWRRQVHPVDIIEPKLKLPRVKEMRPTVEQIKQFCAMLHGITVDDLNKRTRKREIVQARQMAMSNIRQLHRGLSLKSIGWLFNTGYDHSTVIHAQQTWSDLCETDKVLNRFQEQIEAQFNQYYK